MLSRPQKMSRKFFEYLQKSARIKWIYYRLGGREDMTDTKTIKVGLLGLGTVGTGVYKLIGRRSEEMQQTLGPIFSSSPKVMALPLRISFPCLLFFRISL